MSETLKFGNGQWAVKEGSALAYNDENGNFKPLPFTFDRSTSATRVNKEGLIEVVPNNEPRIDFLNDSKGALKLEPLRSNLILSSEDISGTGWGRSGWTLTNDFISPDGTNNAYSILRTTGVGVSTTLSLLANTTYTFSAYIKNIDATNIQLRVQNTAGNSSGTESNCIVFQVTDQTNTDDFVRITHTFNTGDAGGYGIFLGYYSAGEYIIWGAQVEQGYPTSYIPTQGSIGTRDAESCVQTNINTSIISSSYPFTIYVQSIVIATNPYVISFLNNSSSSQSYSIALSANQVYFGARANGTTENLFSGVTIVDGETFKVAVTMESATSAKLAVNGIVVSKTDFTNQGANVNINDLLLGQLRTVSDTGHRLPIKEVKLYNQALSDTELQALTKI